MPLIDMRSDTVTKPTPSMWKAIASADVGDDVYGDDPTINQLEKLAARRMGKESALFVASGTMGNLIATMTHCQRGDEVIVGKQSHIFYDEVGGSAALAGVMMNTLNNQPDGTLKLEEILAVIREDNIHFPPTRLIVLENTHSVCGGVPITAAYTRQVSQIAREGGIRLHIDGARIFNAAVALGVEASELAEPADSITFCLSKGLSAPVGSLLCGSAEFIKRARKNRKMLGGGMRQAGILAAAGIVALEENVERLAEDHRRMKLLAAGLKPIAGLQLMEDPPATNILHLAVSMEFPQDAKQVVEKLKQHGLLCNAHGPRLIRLVTHYWIQDTDIEDTVQIFKKVFSEGL